MNSKWPLRKLSECAKRVGGGTPSRKEESYWGGELPWLTVADLRDWDDIQRLEESRECITESGVKHSAAKLIPPGAVVFSTRVVVGKTGIASRSLATNQDFCSFIPVSSLDSEFLAYFLLKTKNALRKEQRGATIKGVTTKVLDMLDVPQPPLFEQRRIVARIKECMERVEEIEVLQAEVKCAAEATLPAFLKETFLALKVDYPATTIGDLAIDTRYGTSRKCSTLPDGTAILRIPNVAKGSVNREDLKYCSLSAVELQKLALESGDLLFVRTNGSRELVGRCAIFLNPSLTFSSADFR